MKSTLSLKLQAFFQKTADLINGYPHIIRAIAVLPLLISWFIALHKEEYRSAAYRGFLLSTLFLLASWILYWVVLTLRGYLDNSFGLQLTAFTLQGGLSLVYIAISLKLAISEFRQKGLQAHFLDRWKDRLLETI